MLDYAQPQTRASHLSGTSPVYAVETLEKTFQMVGRNAITSVLDQNPSPSAILASNGHCSAVAVELNCVIDKIREHLLETAGVSENNHSGVNAIIDNDRARRGLCCEGSHYIIDHRIKFCVLCLDLNTSRFNGTQLE